MSALPAEFIALLRSPGFEERVKSACREQYQRHRERNDELRVMFFASGGVFARPEFKAGDWFIDSKRDAWILIPSFSLVFPAVFGGFFYLMGGLAAALIVGGLVFLCASLVVTAMVFSTDYLRTPVIKNRRWVWEGRDIDLEGFSSGLVMNCGFTHANEYVRCLVGIRQDSQVELLATHVGGPLIRLVCLAGYAVVDGRFGLETPAPWPEWA